jgi:hypothetical protein
VDDRPRQLLARAALAPDEDVVVRTGRDGELLAQRPGLGRLAHDAVGVGLPERLELARGVKRGDHPRPQHAEQQQLALEQHRVARADRGALAHLAVEERAAVSPERLDLERDAREAHPEVTPREAVAREQAVAQVDGGRLARTLANELHEPHELRVPAADEEPLAVREERDLADALGLGAGPGDDEREGRRRGRVVRGAGGAGGGRLAEGRGHLDGPSR